MLVRELEMFSFQKIMRTYQMDDASHNLPEQMQVQHQHHQPGTCGS